jgi:endonuclease YncB( thermonuclease family)
MAAALPKLFLIWRFCVRKSTKFKFAALAIISTMVWGLGYGADNNAQSLSTPSSTSERLTPVYTVIKCNDGDTCKLKASDNTQVKVRLIGIDSPENAKKRGKKKTNGQPGAIEAKEFLNSLVAGKNVLLKSYGVDMYGRNLAEILFNNESVNLRMVTEGWAEVYRGKAPTGFDLTPFNEAELQAKQTKKGIWSFPDYESPKIWRKKNK